MGNVPSPRQCSEKFLRNGEKREKGFHSQWETRLLYGKHFLEIHETEYYVALLDIRCCNIIVTCFTWTLTSTCSSIGNFSKI